MKRSIPWLGAILILVITFGTIYAVVQQSQRTAANSPQIQIAEDTAAALDQGVQPLGLAQEAKIDINSSLAPFTSIYAKSGRLIASSGSLHGAAPAIPYGVLTAANDKAYNFVTWQPETNVRLAAVSVAANKYYVVTARSLKEVEKNETRSLQLAFLGGIASLVVLAGTFVLTTKK